LIQISDTLGTKNVRSKFAFEVSVKLEVSRESVKLRFEERKKFEESEKEKK